MKLLEKKVVARHTPKGAPLCAFATYIARDAPTLLRRCGWEVSDDIHDGFEDAFSFDNARSWSQPRASLQSTPSLGGAITHTENAALYLPRRDLLVHITNDKFQPDTAGGCDHNYSSSLHIMAGTPEEVSRGSAEQTLVSDFGFSQGLCVSFCQPIEDDAGRILAPVTWPKRDEDGAIRKRGFAARADLPDILLDVWECGVLIGEFDARGELHWKIGGEVEHDFEISSRGLHEGALAQLNDGRLAMVLRASNAAWPEKPNYKWLTFSEDGGESWSPVSPLGCDDGTLLESSATGSALFRSIIDGKLFWIGNLCVGDERPNGNWPRSPLYICEVQEEPFALKRSTLAVVDQRAPHENAQVQHSNFKFYQDRETGEVVLYLTRYGERGSDDGVWIKADLYQYRVSLEGGSTPDRAGS